MEQDTKKQKTAFFRFMELWFQNFWLLLPINFIYSLINALLIPTGLAQAGITNVTRNIARDKHSFGISDFFDTIKANWKQSLIVGIVNTLVTALICFGLLFYYNSEECLLILRSASFWSALLYSPLCAITFGS